ncbi:protein hit [Streptococcus pneumoniae]|nr:protein hit [Streptococcus pneumoniae]
MKVTKAAGMNIISNCEEVAGQTHEPDFDKLAQVAETIKNA